MLYRSYYLVALLIVIAALVIVIKYRDEFPKVSTDVRWLGYLLFINLAIAVFYVMIGRDSVEILKDPVRLACMIPIFLAASIIKVRPSKIFIGLATGLIGAFLMVAYQYLFGGGGRSGLWNNPIPFSEVALTAAIILTLGVSVLSGWSRWFVVVGAIAALFCAILSESRGTLVAVFPVVIGALIISIRSDFIRSFFVSFFRQKKLTMMGVLVAIVFSGLIFQASSGAISRFKQGVTHILVYQQDRTVPTSVGVRLELWYSTWISFKESPLIGIGSDRRLDYLQDLESREIVYLGGSSWSHNHSDYFDYLQRFGLIGLAFVMGLYGLLLMGFWRAATQKGSREQNLFGLGGGLSVISYATYSLTDVPLRNGVSLIFFIVVFSLLLSLSMRLDDDELT